MNLFEILILIPAAIVLWVGAGLVLYALYRDIRERGND